MHNNKVSNKRGLLALAPTEHQATAKRPAVQEASRARALAALKATYGYEAFRGRQEEAVLAALAGRDVLVIMPTGGGKTICYVIPALVQPGVCIVVSPLLALMQDQVANLTKVGVRAAQLSSALPAAQRAAIMEDLAGGGGGGGGGSGQPSVRLLLVTPELLEKSSKFRSVLQRLHARRNLSLFAIDESHCISTWGHDFRPAYRQLRALRFEYPGVPIMALTATAASQVQDDICQQLRLQNPVRLLSSFNRPNISYAVRYLDAEETDEVEALVRLLRAAAEASGGGARAPCSIVYCTKRDTCGAVADRLSREGLTARAYHGQMRDADKKEVLRLWQADEVPVVVATIAFGMGIDKAGVRLVVHFNLPRTLEGFYQEAGRAGRDGRPAESVLFYSREARKRMDYVLEMDQKAKAKKEAEMREKTGSGGGGPGPAAADGSWDDEEWGGGGGGEAAAAELTATAEEATQVKNTAWKSFGEVVDWATSLSCRRRGLLAHFGERSPPGPCGGTGDGHAAGCDYCRDSQHVEAQLAAQKRKEEKAVATRGGRGGGGGKGEDEEADMFAVRGGVAVGDDGGGGGDEGDGGPSVYHAGCKSPPGEEESAAQVAAARSAAAYARAAAGGQVNDKYFATLAAREKEHERRSKEAAGDVVDRMLAAGAGGGGGGGGGGPASAPPPDAPTRSNATSKLAAALAGSQAGGGGDAALLQRLAAAVEANVYGNGLPRQQYTSRMAGLISRAKAAPSPLALLPQAASGGGGGGGGSSPPSSSAPSCAPPPSFAALLPDLLQAEVSAVESLLRQQQQDGSAAPSAMPAAAVAAAASAPAAGVKSGHGSGGCSGGGGGGCAATSRAVARLGALAAVAVTVEAVAGGGVGRRVNKLGRHDSAEVAEAARRVVASWKRQLPEKKASPQPQPPPQQQ